MLAATGFLRSATRHAVLRVSPKAVRFMSSEDKKTVLFDTHVKHGGKMVPFCGWSMPLQYDSQGIMASVQHVRSKCGLFDVSHMGQLRFTGKDRVRFIESLVVGDVAGLDVDGARLSLITNENGGIKDDTIITRREDHLYVVVNAGCFDKDMAHFAEHLERFKKNGGDCTIEVLNNERALVAVQGPATQNMLQRHVKEDLSKMAFMTGHWMKVAGHDCIVTRCGYTGEDGFEISMPAGKAAELTEIFLNEPEVEPAGLGARDSLRLEAGLCLYGNDLNEDTSPVEGALMWTISKRRREEANFLGAETILRQIKEGVARKRVGLLVDGAPARDHADVFDMAGNKIGEVTSGAYSPMLKAPIAMAYVSTPNSKLKTEVQVSVRGKLQKATVTKMPFYPSNYYTPA
mmetsp:Transcript_2668/g.6350  ORF Transcript_2668/g.6350 Transcript_2668/m.6350 type:complete len:403 (+) Transcript_2668:2-1210(+)